MKYHVRITSRAEAELYEAALWWAEHRSSDQAVRWLEGFERAIGSLAEAHERHPRAREDAEFPFGLYQLVYGLGSKPTHRALFRIQGDDVVVYGVRHLAQRDVTPEDL